ncbi:MAG TPA: type II toxin-antitoxin system HipA family toxin [Longimicrobiales bacterium]|nr:type II toxin-antitoxin system HipA family toxin [Longimicrobiales bacterium]
MADRFALAEVRLWGQTVGALVERDQGGRRDSAREVTFEYDDAFRRSGLEISPRHLPLSLRGPVRFDELRASAFQGLPGVFADSLPDAFGSSVIRAYYTARGMTERVLSPVQHLLYVGERAVGALTFHPSEDVPVARAELEALDLARLVVDARSIIAGGGADVAIPEIYRIGSSAGGMRPKAVVRYDPSDGSVYSAFGRAPEHALHAILKFDGVGSAGTPGEIGEPLPYNRVEKAYALMAREAGLDVVDVTVIESDRGHAHLVIPRFDITPDGRLHQHTLGGLLHVDYNVVGASSYEEYLRTILSLGMGAGAVAEGFRRAVFNLVACNQDDHVKNLSFHMDRAGAWRLTPAYDVTFAMGSDFTATHQMRLADRLGGHTLRDIRAFADEFGVRGQRAMVERILDAVARWEEFAGASRVPAPALRDVGAALRARRARLLEG